MLSVGKKAPAFRLPASTDTKIALSDYKGKTVILYFYPRDNTPGCTTEAQGFRDVLPKLKRKGVVVLGVSKDSIESHKKFIAKHKLGFPLLTDDGTVMEKYGAWGEKNMYGKKLMGIIRTTVVIDPDGKVIAIFPKVRVKGHIEKVLEAIAEAGAPKKPAPKVSASKAKKKPASKGKGAARKAPLTKKKPAARRSAR